MYYGYAFESYCTSGNHVRDTKSDDPVGWGGDVDTNVQWCSVVRTKLGNTRLLIGGEVDCVRGQYGVGKVLSLFSHLLPSRKVHWPDRYVC
jgi:RAT1-interacting protein